MFNKTRHTLILARAETLFDNYYNKLSKESFLDIYRDLVVKEKAVALSNATGHKVVSAKFFYPDVLTEAYQIVTTGVCNTLRFQRPIGDNEFTKYLDDLEFWFIYTVLRRIAPTRDECLHPASLAACKHYYLWHISRMLGNRVITPTTPYMNALLEVHRRVNKIQDRGLRSDAAKVSFATAFTLLIPGWGNTFNTFVHTNVNNKSITAHMPVEMWVDFATLITQCNSMPVVACKVTQKYLDVLTEYFEFAKTAERDELYDYVATRQLIRY